MTPWISLRSFAPQARALIHDERGVTAVLLAVLIPTMLGFIGLGVETGMWFVEKRQLQTQADAAVIAAVYAREAAGLTCNAACNAAVLAAGTAMAVDNGFDLTPPATIQINLLGFAPNAKIRAILNRHQGSLFSGIFFPGGVTIGSQAEARLSYIYSSCALALDLSGTGITIPAGASIIAPTCALAADSTAATSVDLQTGGILNAQTVYTAGLFANAGTFQPAPGKVAITDAPLIPDPFNDPSVPVSPSGPCQAMPSAPNPPLPDTLYCDMTFSPGPYMPLSAGTYFTGGSFTVNSSTTTVHGTDVMVVFTGPGPSSVNITAGSVVLAGITDTIGPLAPYKGILFFANAPLTVSDGGSSAMGGLAGAIYAPAQPVNFTASGTSCLEIVAYQITFGGNSGFDFTGPCAITPPPAQAAAVAIVQ